MQTQLFFIGGFNFNISLILYFHFVIKFRLLLSNCGLHFWCPLNLKMLPTPLPYKTRKKKKFNANTNWTNQMYVHLIYRIWWAIQHINKHTLFTCHCRYLIRTQHPVYRLFLLIWFVIYLEIIGSGMQGSAPALIGFGDLWVDFHSPVIQVNPLLHSDYF